MAYQLQFGRRPHVGISSPTNLCLLGKLATEAELNKLLNVPINVLLEDAIHPNNNNPVADTDQIRIENDRINVLTDGNADKTKTTNHT